jgi:hypothetical protein
MISEILPYYFLRSLRPLRFVKKGIFHNLDKIVILMDAISIIYIWLRARKLSEQIIRHCLIINRM